MKVKLPEHERQGLDGMRLTLKAAPGKAKAKPKPKGKHTHGQKCPHCAAHLRPLEASCERETARCIACDGWFIRSHASVGAAVEPKQSEVDPDEGREAREALALFEDKGEPGCALCGHGGKAKHEHEHASDGGSFEQYLNQ